MESEQKQYYNKNTLNSLVTVIHKNKRGAARNIEKVVHPCADTFGKALHSTGEIFDTLKSFIQLRQ